jgi:hypothetical protein
MKPNDDEKPASEPKHKFQLFKLHRKSVIIAGMIILSIVSGILTFYLYSQNASNNKVSPATQDQIINSPAPEPKPEPIKYYSPLTGLLVTNESAVNQPVTGVMIENSLEARPQSGIKDSGVIFEAIAEGGITRFMVLYQTEKPQLIGPVRSLRLYDVDWLAAFNSSIAHVGGSAAALSEIRNGQYRDIDQFFNAGSYWRTTDRYAPHNMYTSFEKLDSLNTAKGYSSSTFDGFKRIDGTPVVTPTATKIDVTISSYLFNSSYAYDAATNAYARSQAGAPHTDRESGQIKPSVVIAMRVDEQTVLEDGWRESIKTIGSGNATIFQNGIAINATWTKTSKLSQIVFTDENGAIIPLNRGQTWIAAVPNDGGNVTWQ